MIQHQAIGKLIDLALENEATRELGQAALNELEMAANVILNFAVLVHAIDSQAVADAVHRLNNPAEGTTTNLH